MKNKRISNEQKSPVWRGYGSLFRAVVLALLLVALLTQGLPMSAIAEQVQDDEAAQTNVPEDPAANAPEPAEDSAPAADIPSNEPVSDDVSEEDGAPQEGNNEQEGDAPQEGNSEQEGDASQEGNAPQEDANAQNAGAKQDDANAQNNGAAQDGKTDQSTDTKKDDAAAKDGKKDEKKNDDSAKKDQKSKEAQKPTNPAIDTRVESNGLIVKIYAPEGAFPEGTTVKVEPASTEKFMAAVDGLVDGDPVDARAVDISFIKDGKEIEPANGRLVSVDLSATSPVGGDDFAAVHIRDNGSTEIVDNKATKQGASFKATDFSVYGIVGGSVIRGEDEQYTRIKVVFRNGSNDGAILSTQIVREGDGLVAPDVTPTKQGETFRSWRAAGKDVDNKYLTSLLTEQDIQDMISAYGATEDPDGTNLWLITIASHYEEGYRAYFHFNEKGAKESDTVVGCLSTGTDGTVHLVDIQGTYKSPYEDLELIGWIDEDDNEYALDATPTLTKDTHLYPEFPTGTWIKLDMGGAPALSDVFAQYNEGTDKYDLKYDDLPNSIVSDEYFYPGYTFDGWYAKKTDDTYSDQITEGSTVQLDDTQQTIFAKWAPSNHVLYTIVYLAEDSQGKPGEGGYYIADWEEKYGTAGAKIPASEYRDHVVDAYHHYCKDEDGERELYNINEFEETIEGDGSTIKVVYFNSNRIRLTCTPTFGNLSGQQILPSSEDMSSDSYMYVKPGEKISDWLSDPEDRAKYDEYVHNAAEGNKKRYIEGNGYSFTGKEEEPTVPYVEANCADKAVVDLTAGEGEVVSQVIAKFYYEELGDETETDRATVTIDDETHKFVLHHKEEWGSLAQYHDDAYEHFGFIYDNGGLVEWAYKGSLEANTDPNEDKGVELLIPEERIGNPDRIQGTYRYKKFYFDHYFVRTRYDLKFGNCENVSPQPTDTKLMFGTKLGNYLPNYTSETTRVYGGATYKFDGWYSNRSAANDPDDPDRDTFEVTADTPMPAQSTTLFAGWSPKTFTITFDAQGGTIKDKGDAQNPTPVNAGTLAVDVVSGQRIPMADRPNDVEREGYIFGGWYLDKGLTIPLDYDTFTSQNDTTIYARWVSGEKRTITYHDADGAVVPSQNDTFLLYSVVNLDGAPEATHDGLPFLGWSTAQGDVNKLVPNTFIIASDVDLYAVYGNVGYSGGPKVTLHANYPNSTEDVKTEPILVSPDTKNGEIMLPDYAVVEFKCPEGYRFVGWTPDQDGTGRIYAAGKPVAVDKDTDLYAVWTIAPEPGTLHQVFKDSNYGGAKVTQSDSQIAEAITLTDDELAAMENGENADFWIEVTDVSSTLDEETKNALHAVMDEGYVKGAYLDITAWVKVGDAEPRQLHETKSALTVAFALASDLKADGRSYETSRSHDGEVARVPPPYADDQFTIDSDRFSFFEIAYKDKGEEKKATNKGTTKYTPKTTTTSGRSTTSSKSTPRTGDPQNNAVVVVLLVVGALVAAAGIYWRRRKE